MRCLDPGGGALLSGMSALIERPPRSYLGPSIRGHSKALATLQPRRGLSPEPDDAGTLDLDVQAPEL